MALVELEFIVSCNTKITRTSFFLLCMFWYIPFYKNLIALHHLSCSRSCWEYFSILFWYLYQIYTFNNNLNDEGMIIYHLMCELHYKQLFYDKNIIKLFNTDTNSHTYARTHTHTKEQQKNLAKHVPWQNHFVKAKFRILTGKRFKRIKNQEITPFGKFVSEVLIFRIWL